MNVSVMNSNQEQIVSEYLGNDAKIVDIEYRENLHLVEICSKGEIYRAFGNSRKRAIGNAIKAYIKLH